MAVINVKLKLAGSEKLEKAIERTEKAIAELKNSVWELSNVRLSVEVVDADKE